MAEMLKDAGYDTAMYGKWHLGWSEGRYPKDQGFDEFYGVESTDQTVWSSQGRWQALGLEPPVVMEGIAGEEATVAREYDLEYRALIDGDLTDTLFFELGDLAIGECGRGREPLNLQGSNPIPHQWAGRA